MAQPFETRLATALRTDRSTCQTLREVIAETEAELARQATVARRAGADSVDVTLNPTERDDAATNADRAKRLVTGYEEAIGTLGAKLAEKEASDRRRAQNEERDAALAERDEIAASFADQVPKALAVLTGLFREVEANGQRLQRAGLHVRDAEAEARDVAGNYYHGSAPIDRFTKMAIPSWSGAGRCWPLDPRTAELQRIQEQEHRTRVEHKRSMSAKGRAERAAAAAAEEAKWRSYRVTHKRPGFIEIACRTGTAAILDRDRAVLELTEAQVADARAKGAKVELAEEGERSTLAGTLTLSATV